MSFSCQWVVCCDGVLWCQSTHHGVDAGYFTVHRPNDEANIVDPLFVFTGLHIQQMI